MKKYILFVLFSFITIFSLASCDTENITKDNHNFELKYDEHNHFDLCECGEKQNEEAHIFSDAIHVITKPTCTTEGINEYNCIVCGYKEQRKVPALGHKYGEYETTVDPTCISKGTAKRTCEVCGDEEFKEIDMISHTPHDYDDLEASCSHEGHIGGSYCDVCHEELVSPTIVDKIPHNFGEWTVTIEADCTHKGQEKRICQDCNYEEYRDIEIKPHTIVSNTEVPSTCTHTGLTGGSHCGVCGEIITPSIEVDKSAHSYGEWETTISPACNHEGQAKRVCTECGHEDYKVLPLTEHTPIPGTAVSSTCIAHGHTAGSYCEVCHKELEAQEELPYSPHNYSIETVIKEPTLNDEGILKHTCSVCFDSYETSIPRLALTQKIWMNSLTSEKFNNKYLELYYEDISLNKKCDITISNKNNIQYIKIYDYNTGKIYEYYYDNNLVIESCVEGYRHRKYDEFYDQYIRNFELIVLNSIYFSSFAYDDVEWMEDGKYYIAQGIDIRNYLSNKEVGTVAIKINDDGLLEMYAYMSSKYVINVQEVGTSPNISIPEATHHHIVNGKCDVCNYEYDTYSITKNDLNLNYYVNKNTKELEFDYSLKYSNQNDVTFTYPTYYENGNIKRFTSLYYEGTTKYYSKKVKSFTLNDNKLLKITYSDYSIERLLLLNDNTAITASSDDSFAYNKYNDNVMGKSFDLVLPNNKVRRYKILSNTDIEIIEYNEISYYIINDIEITDFNRNLENVIGYTWMSNNENGVKPDGTNDYIYFVLDSNLKLTIYYHGISELLEAFDHVTFKDIKGYSLNGNKNYYIYFMGDNVDYVLHYDSNITITKL